MPRDARLNARICSGDSFGRSDGFALPIGVLRATPLIAREASAVPRKRGFAEIAVATPILLLARRMRPFACLTASFTAAGEAPCS